MRTAQQETYVQWSWWCSNQRCRHHSDAVAHHRHSAVATTLRLVVVLMMT